MIRFNKPYYTGKELSYIEEAMANGHLTGDGPFTKRCHNFFADQFGFEHCLLTTSATHALEMGAILANVGPGDEVLLPSYTFVSTANAFALRGAKIVFVDSMHDHPNMDPSAVEMAINPKTKVIVVVHYGGVACEMDRIMEAAAAVGAVVIEDAAQAIDSYYKGKPLGSIGHMAAFSFHETKNISCGEGGLFLANDPKLHKKAEVIREKGTDRSAFFRGEVDKYGWVGLGSSYLPSDMLAAFLFAQLEELDAIQEQRIHRWEQYAERLNLLKGLGFKLPTIHGDATNNGHVFYLVCRSLKDRAMMISFLADRNVKSVFHYQPLHRSEYYMSHNSDRQNLPNADVFGERLLRLPLYAGMTDEEHDHICRSVLEYCDLL